jgi:nucleotide-binding universal stress UspA family protein
MGEAVLPHLEYLVLDSAPRQDAVVTLLRVLPIINFNVLTTDERAQLPYTEDDRDELYLNAYSYLVKVAAGLRRKGFYVTTRVKMGHAAEEIVRLANEIQANMIAMSTDKRAGIIRWAKGSISDKVASLENKIPVLTLHVGRERKNNSFFSFRSLQTILKYM